MGGNGLTEVQLAWKWIQKQTDLYDHFKHEFDPLLGQINSEQLDKGQLQIQFEQYVEQRAIDIDRYVPEQEVYRKVDAQISDEIKQFEFEDAHHEEQETPQLSQQPQVVTDIAQTPANVQTIQSVTESFPTMKLPMQETPETLPVSEPANEDIKEDKKHGKKESKKKRKKHLKDANTPKDADISTQQQLVISQSGAGKVQDQLEFTQQTSQEKFQKTESTLKVQSQQVLHQSSQELTENAPQQQNQGHTEGDTQNGVPYTPGSLTKTPDKDSDVLGSKKEKKHKKHRRDRQEAEGDEEKKRKKKSKKDKERNE